MDALTLLSIALVAGASSTLGVWIAFRFERRRPRQRVVLERVEIVVQARALPAADVAKRVRAEIESLGRRAGVS